MQPLDDITDEDIANFRKDLNSLLGEIIEGDVREIEFVGGPHDGNKYLITFRDGEPAREEISLSIGYIFKMGEEHDAAYYKWNKRKGRYVFDRVGKRTCYEDGSVK